MSAYIASPPVTARKAAPSMAKAMPSPALRGIAQCVDGVQRRQDGRVLRDAEKAEEADTHEPHQHHRAEDAADEAGALPLDREQPDQDDHRDRHHEGRKAGRVDLEALDGLEHRDRRRDRAVAVEESGADQADDEQQARQEPGLAWRAPSSASIAMMPPSPRLSARRIRTAYFTATMSTSDHRISETEPRTASRVQVSASRRGLDGLFQRVEWTRADIAVDNAERAERHGHGSRSCGGAGVIGCKARIHGVPPLFRKPTPDLNRYGNGLTSFGRLLGQPTQGSANPTLELRFVQDHSRRAFLASLQPETSRPALPL